ncbi:MAG: peptidylprolyl isomerase [Gammaproteobacteria bacterium]|nr:peptidylprolyl isomerase [Gammaproteobacteria bacterium]
MNKWLGLILMGCSFCVMAEQLDSVVAIVNDNVVTQTELDKHAAMWRKQMEARKAAMPPEHILQKQVLDRLINESLQLQMAKHSGIMIDNAEIDDTITKIAKDNHLSLPEFREALQKEGLAFDEYRETLRKEMAIARIQQQAVGHDVMVSTEQIEDYLKTSTALEKTTQGFHVQHIVIPLADEPTPEQLRGAEKKARDILKKVKDGAQFEQVATLASDEFYELDSADLGERHLAELPEVFAKRVVNMKVGEIAGPLRTGNGLQLIKLVSVTSVDKHHEVEKTHVRHILIKQDASTTEAQARNRIDNLYEQLKSGKSFETLAAKYSMDLGSGAKGGDLGWVTPEELVPAFAEVMIGLPLKTVSRPVKTGFGWHLVEVLERKAVDDSDTYERQQVRQLLHKRKFMEAVEGWQQHVRGTSYVHILKKELA